MVIVYFMFGNQLGIQPMTLKDLSFKKIQGNEISYWIGLHWWKYE